MSLISFNLKKKLFLPLIASLIFSLFYRLLPNDNYDRLLIVSTSQILCGILNIIEIIRSKRKNLIIDDKIIKKNNLRKNNIKIKIFFLYFLTSIFSLEFYAEIYFFKKEEQNSSILFILTCSIGIIILTIYYSYTEKRKVGRHQIPSIIVSIIFSIVLFGLLFKSFTYLVIIIFLTGIISPINEIIINYLMVYFNISQYKLIFVNGIFHSLYSAIIFNFFIFDEEEVKFYDFNEIIIIIISIILYTLFIICKFNANYHLSPKHSIDISTLYSIFISIYNYILLFIPSYNEKQYDKTKIQLLFIFSLFFFILILLNNEIIIFNFCGLNQDTTLNIHNRARESYNTYNLESTYFSYIALLEDEEEK